jgi:hypothetical protein
MHADDELRQLRRRREDEALARRSPRAPDPGNPTVLARTTVVSAYPTSPQSVYAVQAVATGGAEGEGLPVMLTPGGASFFAANLGSAVPPQGSDVLCTLIGSRWTFRYDG